MDSTPENVRLALTLTARMGAFERLIGLLARKRVDLTAVDARIVAGRWQVRIDVTLPGERLAHLLAILGREIEVLTVKVCSDDGAVVP